MNLVELKSVGSWVDLDKGIVYPSYANGSVDLDCPNSIMDDEFSEEWYSKLSNSDHEVINEFIPYLKLSKKE
tara:strand:- start:255 stop:470 length:216 start_codon:yes stop_codon:yes gene_type:complete